jgi:hypothetical protein
MLILETLLKQEAELMCVYVGFSLARQNFVYGQIWFHFSYIKNVDHFKKLASTCVSEWRRRMYDSAPTDDPHFITFSPFEPAIHEPARRAMVESGAAAKTGGSGRGGGGGGGRDGGEEQVGYV